VGKWGGGGGGGGPNYLPFSDRLLLKFDLTKK
jgi:hypothetical protein